MRISIDNRMYEVPEHVEEKLLQDFMNNGVEMYQKQDDGLRFLLKPVARYFLSKMENALKPRVGKEKAAEVCRPPKKGDPVVHWGHLQMAFLRAMVQHAVLTIETSANSATAFNLQLPSPHQSGGQVAPDGYIGIGENHGAEIP